MVQVDSTSAKALKASGNAEVTASGVGVVGGDSVSGNARLGQVLHTSSLADPLATLAAPSTSGLACYGSVNLGGNGSECLHPGIYNSISVSGNARLTLLPGIYVITSGGISVSGNATVSGSGVLLYLGGGGLHLNGNASVNLTAATSGSYAGIAFFQSRTNSSADSVRGNAQLNLNAGIFYAPLAQLTICGNGEVLTTTELINKLRMSGNALDQ
jgi:hypothetical protein